MFSEELSKGGEGLSGSLVSTAPTLPMNAAVDDWLMILPVCWRFMYGSTARVHSQTPVRFTDKMRLKYANEES